MIWNLYLPPPRGAAVGSTCSDGVSVAAAPLAGACSPTRARLPAGEGEEQGTGAPG